MYYSLAGLCLTAFALCLVLTPLCRDVFTRLGLVDRPDAERKFHLREVPRIGGLPIVISYAASLALLIAFHPGGNLYIQHVALFRELLPAAAIIFITGLLDDIFGLRPWQKLGGQLVASVVALSLGARLAFPHCPPWLSFLLSLFWLIGCTNAFNLIDGMDGLAAGLALIASMTTVVFALISGNIGLALAVIPLVGCLFAFLRYNFNPASIFLGDCGSLTIGFMLGCFSLIWSQHATNLLGMAAPLMALALPLIDVCLAISRRFLRSAPIFQGDRGHIHHMVLDLGFSTRAATLILYAVCGISAALAVLQSVSHNRLGWPILAVFSLLILFGIDRLGYVEWHAARSLLSRINMRQAVQDEIYVVELRRSLTKARTPDDCWTVVREVCVDFDFASAHLELQGSSFSERFLEDQDGSHAENNGYNIQLHLGANDYLVLTRSSEKTPHRAMMTVLGHLQTLIIEKSYSLGVASDPMRSHAA